MNLRRTLMVCALAALFVVPTVVFGHNALSEGSIVPECNLGGGTGPYCQGCDLVHLIQHLIEFAITFSIFVAVIMFVYAGFLYVTASARTENLQKARGVFSSVLIGFGMVLFAWLVIDLILTTFTPYKDGFGYWVEIRCEKFGTVSEPLDFDIEDAGIIGGDTSKRQDQAGIDTRTSEEKAGDESVARSDLFRNSDGQVIVKEGKTSCGLNQSFQAGAGCIDLTTADRDNQTNMDNTLNYVSSIASDCDCNIVVTGGAEAGHASSTYSHRNGYKADLRLTRGVTQFVVNNEERFERTAPRGSDSRYVDKDTGYVWVSEGTHWDICTNASCN